MSTRHAANVYCSEGVRHPTSPALWVCNLSKRRRGSARCVSVEEAKTRDLRSQHPENTSRKINSRPFYC
jgi:hypothetical protein